ncbi:hypothetical protein [Enterovibrio paralichthyis]|uniref:hypothetical protein n=1 Tax=Enterovibrio paralichthyis TaxID=2853805 RepID=UPI001C443208|nr:hypothetical protein [Enterovibrio paralichthyis]MBV7300236.1 hypothetical protein [Enterovibrio paralichthyis]
MASKRITYEQALSDWEFLSEKIGMCNDLTGGFVLEDEALSLLKSPTKATARKLLISLIEYWFHAGMDYFHEHANKSIREIYEEFPEVLDISVRYGIDLDKCPYPFAKRCA